MKTYKKRIEEFLFNKYYMLSLVVITILSYGSAAINTTLDIDDLEGDRYFGDGHRMLSSGRFGMYFWSKISGSGLAYPNKQFYVDLVSIMLLIAATIQFCVLIKKVSGSKFTTIGYILFSCIFISYPLINEIWEFNGAVICVCGGYLFAGISAYLISELIDDDSINSINNKQKILFVLISLFCLTIVCSSYESLATVYVLLVFIILFLKTFSFSRGELPLKKIIKDGLIYASFLVTGVLLRLVVHKIILFACNISYIPNGETMINWLSSPFLETLEWLIKDEIESIFTKAILYFPIAVLFVSISIFLIYILIDLIKNKDIRRTLMGVGIISSLFILAIIQGKESPYRTCQTYALFSAFVILFIGNKIKNKIVKTTYILLVFLLCINQVSYLNNIFSANFDRSQYEIEMIKTIGLDLERNDYNSKIVFVGKCDLPESITKDVIATDDELNLYNKLRSVLRHKTKSSVKFVDTNVNSVINWAIYAFDTGVSANKLFAYYGFDIINDIDADDVAKAEEYVEVNKIPCYPQNGYIVECDEFTIVHLS